MSQILRSLAFCRRSWEQRRLSQRSCRRYPTTLKRIASKLCHSKERKEIFRELLAYRQQLSTIGLNDGFQWLSGSFMEDIESIEKRHPGDLDMATFCHRPDRCN
jgi:hypothetical protein